MNLLLSITGVAAAGRLLPHHAAMPADVILIYLAAAMLFALSLKWLSSPKTARGLLI